MELISDSLCTIGYQGKNIDEFIKDLLMNRVEVLVDVRRRALSRKPGFSKTKLRSALEDVGVTYVHFPQLGMPHELMPQRNLKDNSAILAAYSDQLSDHSQEIDELIAKTENSRICLLCFEADHELCHRNVLANRIAQESGSEVEHL